MTKYARAILGLINQSTDHLTAEQIYLRMKEDNPRIVLATVYNNLNLLFEKNMIRKVSVEGYPDRYDKMTRHDHLVCRECGGLSDILLDDLTDFLSSQIDEEILSYDLKLSYICPACRKKQKH